MSTGHDSTNKHEVTSYAFSSDLSRTRQCENDNSEVGALGGRGVSGVFRIRQVSRTVGRANKKNTVAAVLRNTRTATHDV